MADLSHHRLGIINRELEVLCRQGIDEVRCLGLEVIHQNDDAVIVPALLGCLYGIEHADLHIHTVAHQCGKTSIIGDEDRLRSWIVLGLTEQVCCNPVRVILAVGYNQNFGRTCDHIDADHAVKLSLRFGYIGIAWADDDIDRLDTLCAIRKRADSLSAAYTPDLINSRNMRCCKHQRVRIALRCRGHDHNPLNACNPGRDRVHQKRRWIGRASTRDIEPRCIDWPPDRAKTRAGRILVVPVFGELRLVIRSDPVRCELKGLALLGFHCVIRFFAALWRNHPVRIIDQRVAIKALGVLDKRAVLA